MSNLRWLLPLLTSFAAYANQSAVSPAEVLAAHNQLRHEVGVPPLRYSHPLVQSAQAWANHLKRSRACQAEYSSGTLGENVYLTQGSGVGITEVIHAWGAEKTDYRHYRCRGGQTCGNYTQIVWKTTTRVGCAVTHCPSGDQLWVCHYFPAGNFEGEKPY